MACRLCFGVHEGMVCGACLQKQISARTAPLPALQSDATALQAQLQGLLDARAKQFAALRAVQSKAEILAKQRRLFLRKTQLVNERRVAVSQLRVACQQRREALQTRMADLDAQQMHMGGMQRPLVDALAAHLADCRRELASRAWGKLRILFDCFPLEAGSESVAQARSGVGKICGLPLSNNGDVHLLPPELQRGVLHVLALLVASAAGIMGVQLPHPLEPRWRPGFAAIRASEDEPAVPIGPVGDPAAKEDAQGRGLMSNFWFFPSYMGGSPVKESAVEEQPPPTVEASGDELLRRGVELLQADVVELCLGLGVAEADLGPKEAILWNLSRLREQDAVPN